MIKYVSIVASYLIIAGFIYVLFRLLGNSFTFSAYAVAGSILTSIVIDLIRTNPKKVSDA